MQEAVGVEEERRGRAQSKSAMNYFGFWVDLTLYLLFCALENSIHDETAKRKLKGF